jgi:hypothetical protein
VPSFGLPVDYGASLSPLAVVAADFNGDGRLDLATANPDDNTISVLLGNGDGRRTAIPSSPHPATNASSAAWSSWPSWPTRSAICWGTSLPPAA